MSKQKPKFNIRHRNLKREVVVRLTDRDTNNVETFAVEWPEECVITLGEFQSTVGFMQEISEVASCHNCAHQDVRCHRTSDLKVVRRNAYAE